MPRRATGTVHVYVYGGSWKATPRARSAQLSSPARRCSARCRPNASAARPRGRGAKVGVHAPGCRTRSMHKPRKCRVDHGTVPKRRERDHERHKLRTNTQRLVARHASVSSAAQRHGPACRAAATVRPCRHLDVYLSRKGGARGGHCAAGPAALTPAPACPLRSGFRRRRSSHLWAQVILQRLLHRRLRPAQRHTRCARSFTHGGET